MKNKLKLLLVLPVAVLMLYGWQHLAPKRNVSVEDKSLSTLPNSIKKVAMSQLSFDEASYKEAITSSMPQTYEFHKESGEKLYLLAMSSNFYGQKKLKLLSMAKQHLFKAKEMRN